MGERWRDVDEWKEKRVMNHFGQVENRGTGCQLTNQAEREAEGSGGEKQERKRLYGQ